VQPATAASLPALREGAATLRAQGAALLAEDGVLEADRRFSLAADMRYRGQAFELVVPWGDVAVEEDSLATLIDGFHALHERRFSYSNEAAPVEMVALRLTATGLLPQVAAARGEHLGATRVPEARRIFLDGQWQQAEVHQREQVTAAIAGPALIEEEYTTIYVAPGWRCAPGPDATLVARKDAA